MYKAKELRDQSAEELKALYSDLSKGIFVLNNEVRKTRKLEKPHQVKEKKRDRARVLTVLREKGGRI